MSPASLTLLALAILSAGVLIGYAFHHWRFLRARKAMASDWYDIAFYHQQHADRIRQDDTRLGINVGIEFALARMHGCLEELADHITEVSPDARTEPTDRTPE